MPIVTINSAQGDQETRVIPELAQSPLIHWVGESEDKAMECFSILIREALFNVKNTLEAIRYLYQYPKLFRNGEHLIINRLPDPITLTNLISLHGSDITVHYPGQGIKAIAVSYTHLTLPTICSV